MTYRNSSNPDLAIANPDLAIIANPAAHISRQLRRAPPCCVRNWNCIL